MKLRFTSLVLFLQPIFYCLFLAFPALSQGQKVNGYIKGIKKTPIVFRYDLNGDTKMDTVLATNDRFQYNASKSDDGRILMMVSEGYYFGFWSEPGELTLSGTVEKPYAISMKGGKDNTIEDDYNKQLRWPLTDQLKGKSDSERSDLFEENRKASLEFIKSHPDGRISAVALTDHVMMSDQYLTLYEEIFQKLAPSVQQSDGGKEAKKRIVNLKNQPAIGKVVSDFTLPDTSGKQVALSSFKGKYVLLDFWGHWCSPCIKAFPKLVELHGRYQGKLSIVGVAAEHSDDKDKWTNAIKNGGSKWVQLSELEGDKGEVNKRFNILGFPTYFLLDKDGVLVKRTYSMDEMEETLHSLLD